MTLFGDSLLAAETPPPRIAARKERLAEIRNHARGLMDGGATGIQVAADIAAAIEALLVEIFLEKLQMLPASEQSVVTQHSAVVAVGGSGRGEMAPYSDADLLFLYDSKAAQTYSRFVAQVVRDYWDAGIKLGHAVRTIGDSASMARQDPQVATTLSEARLLWGSGELFERLRRTVRRRVVQSRLQAFVADCIRTRESERAQQGLTSNQLEPDVKRSLGGLRDIHLIRWIGFGHFGTTDIESLRLKGALAKEDARRLLAAQDFLMQVRNELHFAAGKANDVLTRDEQLRIAHKRGIEGSAGQRPVERFMQTYFRHAAAIADVSRRFTQKHRPRTWRDRLVDFVMTHRADGIFKVGPRTIDVVARYRPSVSRNIEQILRVYYLAALYGVVPSLELCEAFKESVRDMDGTLNDEAARLFRNILGRTGCLGATLRSMHDFGILEYVVPDVAHARCLMQFNQYHSYTVDEHTLRAIEAAEQFDRDEGPVGAAYRNVKQRQLLHLALLLHDLGKGFEEDHSIVGEQIALRTAQRLRLSDHDRETLAWLVRHHLKMAHVAFRRDIDDADMLVEFSRDVGSPELLRLLFVLTAADFAAVGPGVWTSWKAEVLSGMFNRSMLILSGKPYQYHEEERLSQVKKHVRKFVAPKGGDGQAEPAEWVEATLNTFPPHYLGTTPPERIAADLRLIAGLKPGEVIVEGEYDSLTHTVDYRVVAHERDFPGCFHRICGALTAKRLEILSAQISTSREGVVVDAYKVIDNDYARNLPDARIAEVAESIRAILTGKTEVPELFRRHRRFGGEDAAAPLTKEPTRVVIDNQSSDRCTIIDVFTHDRPALLYTITRTIYELGLSVELAKISTHLDQVVDVFYVTDLGGQKVQDEQRLEVVRETLLTTMSEFTLDGKNGGC